MVYVAWLQVAVLRNLRRLAKIDVASAQRLKVGDASPFPPALTFKQRRVPALVLRGETAYTDAV